MKSNIIDKEPVHPINAIYSSNDNTIILATPKQIRVYNAQVGELLEIYQIAIEDEMTFFDRLEDRTFVAGTEQGRIKIYNHNGDVISDFQAHSN